MLSQNASPNRRLRRHAAALMAALVIAGTTSLAVGATSFARSDAAAPEPTSVTFQQQASPGAPIPITPLTGVTSLDATVVINVDGTVDGKPTTGDLTAKLTTNDQAMSQIDVTGSLLGDVVAKVVARASSCSDRTR